jgi:glycerol-3-phosphate acyltransferase PlsY
MHSVSTFATGALLFGYLLGSIPFGLIFSHLSGSGDVRKIGSGSIGATNVLRTGKKWAALATVLADAAKGTVAVLVLRHLHGDAMAALAALGAVLGHLFPMWLKFKGGKGVATFYGVMFALYWPAALIAGATWIAMAFAFRISSLSALVATALTPAYLLAFGQHLFAVLAIVLGVLIWIAHRSNIARLLKGEEPRIGQKQD